MRPGLMLALLLTATPGAGLAHHSISGLYDTGRSVSIRGRLTLVKIENPHSRFELDAEGVVWKVESRGVAGMDHRGFDVAAFKVGDRVTIKGSPARDGSRTIWLDTLSKGRRTFQSRR